MSFKSGVAGIRTLVQRRKQTYLLHAYLHFRFSRYLRSAANLLNTLICLIFAKASQLRSNYSCMNDTPESNSTRKKSVECGRGSWINPLSYKSVNFIPITQPWHNQIRQINCRTIFQGSHPTSLHAYSRLDSTCQFQSTPGLSLYRL